MASQALVDKLENVIENLTLELAAVRKERDELQARIDGGIRVEASLINHNSPTLVCASNEDNDRYANATLILDEGVTL